LGGGGNFGAREPLFTASITCPPHQLGPAWTEVKESIEPAQFNIKNFGQSMTKEDPWKDFFKSRQSLAPAIFQTEEIVVFSMPRIAKRFHVSDKIPKQA
jgi:hypothetical protein